MTEAEDKSAPWVTLSEAASRTGRHIDALRSLVRRHKLPARKNNAGQWLVQMPPELTQHDLANDAVADTAIGELRAEVTELREALAEAKAEARAAHDVADARVDAVRAEVTAKDVLIRELRELLADARRPWWRRLIG